MFTKEDYQKYLNFKEKYESRVREVALELAKIDGKNYLLDNLDHYDSFNIETYDGSISAIFNHSMSANKDELIDVPMEFLFDENFALKYQAEKDARLARLAKEKQEHKEYESNKSRLYKITLFEQTKKTLKYTTEEKADLQEKVKQYEDTYPKKIVSYGQYTGRQ